jgi:hypothetical protein
LVTTIVEPGRVVPTSAAHAIAGALAEGAGVSATAGRAIAESSADSASLQGYVALCAMVCPSPSRLASSDVVTRLIRR